MNGRARRDTGSGPAATVRLVRRILAQLPAGSRTVFVRYSLLTSALALLDILSLGVFASLLPAIVAGRAATLPLIGTIEGEGFVVAILVVAGIVVLKSALSVVIVRRGTLRFAALEVGLGDALFSRYLRVRWVERLRLNSADLVRSIEAGASSTVSGALLPASFLTGELVTSVAVVVVLLVAQPLTAVVTLAYLGVVGLVLTQQISRRAIRNGRINRDQSSRAQRLVTEAISMLKEIAIRGAEEDVRGVVLTARRAASRSRAIVSLLGVLPRYFLEAALVVGFLLVGAVGWISGGVPAAVTSIALFAVAGFRIIPSLTRVQAILSQMHANAPYAELVLDQLEQLPVRAPRAEGPVERMEVPADIELRGVGFTYPGSSRPALDDVSLRIAAGSRVAFVGPSGAGKSTMVDLILGLIEPDAGIFTVGGRPVADEPGAWQARVGYVPQEVTLFDASIAQNVALRWSPEGIDRDRVVGALAQAQLSDFLAERADGIDSAVGERGLALSGGQRQRLGIARALYSRPDVLVLDEATSALDTTTEAAVTDAIASLGRDVTVITVAHRLSTIRDADTVFFFDDGRLVASGRFADLVAAVPDFARQAALAGLTDEGP